MDFLVRERHRSEILIRTLQRNAPQNSHVCIEKKKKTKRNDHNEKTDL